MNGEIERQDFLGEGEGGTLGQCVARIAVKGIKIFKSSILLLVQFLRLFSTD